MMFLNGCVCISYATTCQFPNTNFMCDKFVICVFCFAYIYIYIYICKRRHCFRIKGYLACVLQKTWGLSQDLFVFCN
jgi:hypothetical protein